MAVMNIQRIDGHAVGQGGAGRNMTGRSGGDLLVRVPRGTIVHDVDTGELILLVNGRMAHWQTPLTDGDVLKLVPAIGGGAG